MTSPSQKPPDNTQHSQDTHPCPRRDSNPQAQQTTGRRPSLGRGFIGARTDTTVWTGSRQGSWTQPGQTYRIKGVHTSCDVCPDKCRCGVRRQLRWSQHLRNTDNEHLSGHSSSDRSVQTVTYKRISCSQPVNVTRCTRLMTTGSKFADVE